MIKREQLDCMFDEKSDEHIGKCKGSNPVALLEMAYQWKCNKSPPPIYTKNGEGIDATFTCLIAAGKYKCTGEGKNKTEAQNIAAYNTLMEMINNGEFVDYSLPGETKEEALAYLESIKPAILSNDVEQVSQPILSDDNVYSKKTDGDYKVRCVKICNEHNLGAQPIYECDEGVGPSHKRHFTCKVSFSGIPDISVVATTKKLAENWAAFHLYKELEKLPPKPKDNEV